MKLKMPWEHPIMTLEKKIENTFSLFKKWTKGEGENIYKKAMQQINIVKKSNQTKNNRLSSRLDVLENCLKKEIKSHNSMVERQERKAAQEVDGGRQ